MKFENCRLRYSRSTSSKQKLGDFGHNLKVLNLIIIKFPIELLKYRNRTAKISADITILLFKVIW